MYAGDLYAGDLARQVRKRGVTKICALRLKTFADYSHDAGSFRDSLHSDYTPIMNHTTQFRFPIRIALRFDPDMNPRR
jgi:hypothetical protein